MKVIIAGWREFTDYELLNRTMESCGFPVTEVVSGKARGADTLGERWANENGIPVKPFPANWDRYGDAAGSVRNEEMARYGEALVAFLAKESKGTKDMIRVAKRYKLKVKVVNI
jgi:hypothetical protein